MKLCSIGSLGVDSNQIDPRIECSFSLCGEEDVREEDCVCVGVDAEGAAEGLEDHAEEVPRVEADQRDQQQVERVTHLVPVEHKRERERK